MRTQQFGSLAALASTFITSTCAIHLAEPRAGHAPRVVEHEIRRRDGINPLHHDRYRASRLRKRADSVNVPLTNEETLYFMQLSVGTPAQDLKMHIDTGSSDMWVNVADSKLCEHSGDPCKSAGTYNSNSSSTYKYINSDFNITYVDGTGSVGDYASDVVKFNGVTLKGQQFGIGYSSSSTEGIIGIGYELNEVAVSSGDGTYPNVPASMVSSGYINTNAYSLWLNDLDANTGSILFGGVNSAKYTGELETVPIIPEGNAYAEFLIALTAVGMNGKSTSVAHDISVGALLDSGSSLIYLPDGITNDIYKAVGAQYDSSQGAAFVDCSLSSQSGSVDFTFSSPTIRVPYNELVLVAGVQDNQPICILGIAPSGSSSAVLGDTFIRSAYVVYDLDQNEISLAQTDFNSTGGTVQEIRKGQDVPSATMVQNAITSVASYSSEPRLGSGIGIGSASISSSHGAAQPTAAVGYNLALLGAAGAAVLAL